jgi:hypothetical protein
MKTSAFFTLTYYVEAFSGGLEMQSANNYRDKRSEPRFQPDCEQVRWRRPGSTELEAGEMLDISKTGLSFRIPVGKNPPLRLGDELSVGLVGSENRPLNYMIVWEHWTQGSLAVGCSRLSSNERVSNVKIRSPKLVLAMSRLKAAFEQGVYEPKAYSVILGAQSI